MRARFLLGAIGMKLHLMTDSLLKTSDTRPERQEHDVLGGIDFARTLLENSGDWISVLDAGGKIEFINTGGLQLLDVDDFATITGSDWLALWQGETVSLAKQALAEANATGTGRFSGSCVTSKGAPRNLDVRVTVIAGRGGKPDKLLSISRDMTELKASEEQTKLLMAELLHRGNNLLALVQAIANQTFRGDIETERKGNEFSGRLKALARLSDGFGGEGAGSASIRVTIESALDLVAKTGAVCIKGPDIDLTRQQSQILGLAMHELLMNSLNYGSLSVAVGEVHVAWADDGQQFQLEWVESHGPEPEPRARKGFGTTLLERVLPATFGGNIKMSFDPGGLTLTLTGPSLLPHVTPRN